MPDINGSHNGSQVFVPVVLVPVGLAQDAYDPQHLSRPGRLQVLTALVDTGAQNTSITPAAAERLQLDPIGLVRVHGVGGANLHQSYLFRIGFVDLRQNELGIQNPQIHLIDREIQGAEFDCGPAKFDVLLGMDILSQGTLTVSKDGRFRFSF